jgi:hypothetical protein
MILFGYHRFLFGTRHSSRSFRLPMSRIPPETPSWDGKPDPDKAARELREALAKAKARMDEHRETMRAAGLTTSKDAEGSAG